MNPHVFRELPDGSLALVGEWDALYRSERDPWDQSARTGAWARYYQLSRQRLVAALLRHQMKHDSIGLEVGCGHGHVTHYLAQQLKVPMIGLDASREAVKEARRLYPQELFVVNDITAAKGRFTPLGHFNFVVLGQCLWYLLHAIDQTIDNIYQITRPGGLLVISQAFLKEQRYGRDIAHGFEGLLSLFLDSYSPEFRLIEASYDDSNRFDCHDGLLVFRKQADHADRSDSEQSDAESSVGGSRPA